MNSFRWHVVWCANWNNKHNLLNYHSTANSLITISSIQQIKEFHTEQGNYVKRCDLRAIRHHQPYGIRVTCHLMQDNMPCQGCRTPSRQAGTQFSHPTGTEGWVYLVDCEVAKFPTNFELWIQTAYWRATKPSCAVISGPTYYHHLGQ